MNELIPCYKNIDSVIMYGYCNNSNIVIPYIYEFAYPFTCGLGGVRSFSNHLVGFIDCNGNKLIDFMYDYIHPFYNNYSWVCLDGLWGMIDITGGVIIPYKYIKASKCISSLTIVQNKNSKWGVVNICDDTIIPFIYDFIYYNDDYIGLLDGKWNRIDCCNKCKVLNYK